MWGGPQASHGISKKRRQAFTKALAAGLAVFSAVPMVQNFMPEVGATSVSETVEDVKTVGFAKRKENSEESGKEEDENVDQISKDIRKIFSSAGIEMTNEELKSFRSECDKIIRTAKKTSILTKIGRFVSITSLVIGFISTAMSLNVLSTISLEIYAITSILRIW